MKKSETLKNAGNMLCELLTGSRKYNTEDDKSDNDLVGVYCLSHSDFLNEHEKYFVEGDNRYVELNHLMNLLRTGDLTATEIISAPYKDFKYISASFYDLFLKEQFDLINKTSLNNWVNSADFLFNKAIRLGKIKLNKPNIFDYLRFYYTLNTQGTGTVQKMSEILVRKTFDPKGYTSPDLPEININSLGLKPLGFRTKMYSLYTVYHKNDNNVLGLLDENKELIENGIVSEGHSSLCYKGILEYDKTGYEKAKRLYKNLQSSKVINGYATKIMCHAFRTLFTALHALTYQKLLFQLPEAPFLVRIKKGEEPLEDLITKFNELYDSAVKILEVSYDGPSSIHLPTLIDIETKCREKISKKPQYAL